MPNFHTKEACDMGFCTVSLCKRYRFQMTQGYFTFVWNEQISVLVYIEIMGNNGI
jgi:hypothetical protein